MSDKWIRVASLSELPTEGLGHAVKVAGLGYRVVPMERTAFTRSRICAHILGFR